VRALPILLVSVAILLICEPSHIRQVKTGDTNDLVQTCSFELSITAEFRGTDFAWIVTSSSDLLYTRDGGEKWSKITADTVGGFSLLSFIDENTGWGISWSGKLWRTENGGETWVSIADQSNPNAPSIVSAVDFKFVDKLHGWILGPFLVWRTMDGGNTWQPYAPPNQAYYHFYSLFFLDSDDGWIAGDHGTVYHTEDSGETWEEIEVGSEEKDCNEIFFVSKSIGWLRGSREKLYRTLDGGRSWKPLSYPIPGEDWYISSVRFLNRNEGWAVGWGPDNNVYENTGGIALHTADGGVSWKEVDIKHSESFYELVHFSDSQNGWILSRRNVYRTVDGGKTWSNVLQLPQSRTE
jgi:photosystem II stability/assembly factor-like uncharacterized protein